jgi:surface protein
LLFFDCLNNINITLTKHIYIKRKTISSAIKILSLEGVPPFQVYSCDYALNNCQLVATLENPVQAINDIILPSLFDNSPNIVVKIISFDGCETFKFLNCGDFPTPSPTPTPLPSSFTSIWRTTSSTETIYLPLESGGTYNFSVNWGDGNIETITSYLTNSHEYAVAGDYTVTITGTIEGWNFQTVNTSRNKIIEILRWGQLKLGNNGGYFKDTTNLILTGVTDTLNLVGVTDMSLMFFGCSSITTVNNMNSWDVSNVTSLFQMFYNAVLFNQDISNWDVSNVPDMSYTFQNAISFNQPLNNWNVSGVTSMLYMFVSAGAFNQDISSWNVSNVTNMFGMFQNTPFNQPIGSWNVANVTNMGSMFEGSSSFNQNISSWNVSGVTQMNSIFEGASLFNQPIGSWNVSGVTSMNSIFSNATSFNQDIGSWNVSNVTSMNNIFSNATSFNNSGSTSISGWTTSAVTTMDSMFYSAIMFNQDIGSWDVTNVTDMDTMFFDATSFNQDLSGWCVTNIPSEPTDFYTGASSWILPQPVWGTCP